MVYYSRVKSLSALGSAMMASQNGRSNTVYGRSNSQSLTTRKRKRTTKSTSVKSQLMKMKPAFHLSYESAVALNNNALYTVYPTQAIVQGTSNTNRLGDSITLCAMKVRGIFNTATLADGYRYRIIVGWTGEEYTSPTALLTSALAPIELYLPFTGGTLLSNGIVNPKAFTALYDETIDINSQTPTTNDLSSFAFTVPLNDQLFEYQSGGSIYGKTKNLAIVVMGYGIASAAGTCGGVTCTWDLVFKNA